MNRRESGDSDCPRGQGQYPRPASPCQARPRRRIRLTSRVRIRIACLLALAAVATAVAVPGALGRGQAQPRCVAGQLTGKVLGSNGGAGTIVVSIVLRNGGPPCTLKGFTGLQMYAGSGRPIRTRVQHGNVPESLGRCLDSSRCRTAAGRRSSSRTPTCPWATSGAVPSRSRSPSTFPIPAAGSSSSRADAVQPGAARASPYSPASSRPVRPSTRAARIDDNQQVPTQRATPVRRIAVATDRSKSADFAVAWAADMAARYEAELLVLQVIVPRIRPRPRPAPRRRRAPSYAAED